MTLYLNPNNIRIPEPDKNKALKGLVVWLALGLLAWVIFCVGVSI